MASGPGGKTTGGHIQRIIHQIWLGNNPRPEEWMKTVRDFAAAYGYEYKLWDDSAAQQLSGESAQIIPRLMVPGSAEASEALAMSKLDWGAFPGLRDLYDEFGERIAGKADIIRLLALYKYGGIYIDADSVIMKPAKFAEFLEKNPHGMFFAWEELERNGRTIENPGPELRNGRDKRLIANGTIGARRGHRFVGDLLDGMVAHAQREKGADAWRRVGPLYVTRLYWALKDTAPYAVEEVHNYPMELFYPLHWHGIKDPEMHKKVQIPGESMLFQYGYSTNGFADIFRRRNTKAGGGRRSRRSRSSRSSRKLKRGGQKAKRRRGSRRRNVQCLT
jgi:hypothetical protein